MLKNIIKFFTEKFTNKKSGHRASDREKVSLGNISHLPDTPMENAYVRDPVGGLNNRDLFTLYPTPGNPALSLSRDTENMIEEFLKGVSDLPSINPTTVMSAVYHELMISGFGSVDGCTIAEEVAGGIQSERIPINDVSLVPSCQVLSMVLIFEVTCEKAKQSILVGRLVRRRDETFLFQSPKSPSRANMRGLDPSAWIDVTAWLDK